MVIPLNLMLTQPSSLFFWLLGSLEVLVDRICRVLKRPSSEQNEVV